MRRGWRLGGVLAVCAAVWFAAPAPESRAAAPQAEPSFFDTVEVRSDNMKPFTKWTAAIERYAQEKEKAAQTEGSCKSKTFNKCHYTQWMKMLAGLMGKTKIEQVDAINTFMNRAKYVTDDVNWGESDFWETPGEFITRFGDCEDYAIAKFMSLRILGFTDDEMRIVAVKDLNLKVGHAILIVFVDGKTVVLDNQIKQLIEAERVRHYLPVFSINTAFWWRHRR